MSEDSPRIDDDKRLITMRMSSFDSREVATFVTGTLPVFYGIQAWRNEPADPRQTGAPWRIWIELAGVVYDLVVMRHEDDRLSFKLEPLDGDGLGERRRQRLVQQVGAAMAALKKLGVEAELIGSFAWGGFGIHSDIDILVPSERGQSRGVIIAAARDGVREATVDVIFWNSLSEGERQVIANDRRRHTTSTQVT